MFADWVTRPSRKLPVEVTADVATQLLDQQDMSAFVCFLGSSYLIKMPYKEFLMTPYWQAVSWAVRRRYSNKCALCASDGRLHVHHRDYGIHGCEHLYLDELVALCQKCHAAFHGKSILV